MKSSHEVCFWCSREIGEIVNHKRYGYIVLRKHIDHLVPRSYYRNNSKPNLKVSCHLCNLWKSDIMFDSLKECREYLKRKWEKNTNEQVQVLQQGISAEEELAAVLQQEMPGRPLAPESMPDVSELRDASVIRGQKEKAEKRTCKKCLKVITATRRRIFCSKRCHWAFFATRHYRRRKAIEATLPSEVAPALPGQTRCARKGCERHFTATTHNRLYCTNSCRVSVASAKQSAKIKHQRVVVTRYCKGSRCWGVLPKGQKSYCSKPCQYKAMLARLRANYKRKKEKAIETKS